MDKTNRYAQQSLERKEFTPLSRKKKWIPTDDLDVMAFIGSQIGMGMC